MDIQLNIVNNNSSLKYIELFAFWLEIMNTKTANKSLHLFNEMIELLHTKENDMFICFINVLNLLQMWEEGI